MSKEYAERMKKKKEEEAANVASSSANKMAQEIEKQRQNDTGLTRAQKYFEGKTIVSPEVSNEDINRFLNDTKSYFQRAQERYNNNTYSTSKKNADDFFAESDSMCSRADEIRVFLSFNKDKIDKDTYNQLKSALDAFDSGSSSYRAAFAKANNYYSNWKTEEAYNEAQRQAKLQSLSTDELENKIKENKDAQKEANKNKSTAFWTNMLDSLTFANNKNKGNAGEKLKSDSNDYEHYADEVKQLKEEGAELRSYLNTAKDNDAREKIGKIGGDVKGMLDKIADLDYNISIATQAQSKAEKWNNNSYSNAANEDYKNRLIIQRQELKDRLKGMASQYGFKDENELVDYYEKFYNERQTEALKTEVQDFAKEHPVLAEATSLALNDIYADTGVALGSMLGTALDKDGTGLDQNSAWYARNNIRNAIEEQNAQSASDKIKIGDWDLGKDAYQMVHSALDSAVSMLQAAPFTMMFPQGVGSEAARKAIQTLGTTLISSRSAVQEIINQKENGASDLRAVSRGAAAWVIETLTETVGLDTLLGHTKLGEKLLSKGLVGIVLNNMVGGVTEGSEELVGNWLTRALDVIDNMSTGEKSEWMKKYEQLVRDGVDKKEATKQILSDMLSEDRESFIVGFGSGLGMAAVGSTGNALSALGNDAARIMQGAEIRAKGNPDALINYAQNIDADVKTKNRLEKLAQKAVRKETTAQKYKDRNNLRERIAATKANSAVGRLYSEILDEADRNDTKSAIRDRIAENGNAEDAKALADIVFKEATGEELTKTERKQFEASEEAQSALKELIGNAEWARNYGTRNAVENAAYGVDKETALKVTPKENRNVPVKQIARVKAYTPTSTVYTDAEGNTVNGDDITLGKGGDTLLNLVNRKGDINYANIVLENYNGQSVVRYTNAASRFYEAGRNDESFDAVKKIDIYGNYIDEKTARMLYHAGKHSVVRDSKGRVIKTDKGLSVAKHYSDEEYNKKQKTGGVIRNYTRKLNMKQKIFVTFASKVGEKFGVVFVIDDTIDGGRTNGFYNYGNEIHIALDARGELYTAVAGHELYHYLKQNADRNSIVTFNKTVLDSLKKNGFNLEAEIKKEREGKYGDTMTDDEIIEEIIADNCYSVLTSETIEDIVKKDASLGQKIKDFLSKFIEAVREAGGSLNSDMTKYLDIDALESIEKQFATLLEQANNKSDYTILDDGDIEEIENLLNDTGFIYDEQSDSLNFDAVKESRNFTTEDTLEDWTYRKKSIKEVFTAAGKKIGLTDEQINAAIKTENFMVKYAETVYGEATEENGKFYFGEYTPTGRNPYRKNSDYPQGTFDFSTCCPKRVIFTKVFENIQRNRVNKLFTAEELANLRRALLDRGYTVQCGLCYVEDRRQLAGEVADLFMKDWKNSTDKFVKVNSEGKETVLKITGTAYKKWGSILKRNGINVKSGDVINPSLFKDVEINQYLINTAEGYEQLTKDAPYVAMAYDVYNNSRGMQAIRRMDGREEYDRQILKWSQKKIDQINRNGGLRIFSYSDFEVAHMIDLMQIIMDCQVKGVKIQCYTKQKNFVEFAKKTGIKLNRSFIPKGELGYHMEGNKYVLDFDAVEGIDGNDSEYLNDNYADIGNIIIGINERQIKLAMADDRINFIIPFHTSKETVVNKKLGVGGWVNYKDSQTEKDAATGKGGKNIGVNIYDILSKLESQHGNNITEEMFVNAFLDECKQNNWTPRFAEFLNKKNGEYVFTPGYYKFLVDFKLFDTKTGAYLPQTVVRADFDLDVLKEIMDSDNKEINKTAEEVMVGQLEKKGMSEKEAKAKVKKDLDSIAAEVTESKVTESKIKASRNAEYLEAVENGDEKEAQRLVDEAAKDWGALTDNKGNVLKLYHGTSNGEFFEFDEAKQGENYHGWARLGKGFYFTKKESSAKIWAEKGKGVNEKVISVYIQMKNGLDVYEAVPEKLKKWLHDNIYAEDGFDESTEEYMNRKLYRFIDYLITMQRGDEIKSVLSNLGYDGIYSGDGEEYVVWNANQIKSADTVTYDDNGEVIPLSERFSKSKDIRWSKNAESKIKASRNDDYGYHAGDLGKAEYYFNMSGSRSSGHFGTGTYFVGDEERINKSRYGERPHHKVDFSNYNLFKPKSSKDAYALHDALKQLNNYSDYIQKDFLDYLADNKRWIDWLKEKEYKRPYSLEKMDDMTYNEILQADKDSLEAYAKQNGIEIPNKEKYADSEDEDAMDYYVDDLREAVKEYDKTQENKFRYFEQTYDDLVNLFGDRGKVHSALQSVLDYKNEHEGEAYQYANRKSFDSLSTVFMKAIGYEGVDVRGTDLDNTQYGSVIYDLNEASVLYSLNDVRENLDTLEELVEDDEDAAKIVKLLKDDFKVTNRHNLSREDIDKEARQIVKNWDSNYDAKKLADNLEKIYDYVANGVEVETENGTETEAPSFETAFNAMRSLAREVMEDSYHEEVSERTDRIKELKKELRGTRIFVDDITKGEIAYSYDSYEKFRRSHIGKLRLVNDKTAMSADKAYEMFREEYPEFFEGDEPSSHSDMLLDLIRTVDSLEPTYQNDYFMEPEQITNEIAEDIYEGFYDIKEHKTLVEQQKALRQKQKARYEKKLEEVKARYESRIKSEKAEKWERVAKEREEVLKAVARKELKKEGTENRRAIRKKISAKVKKLNNLLVNPTDQKHIPEELKKAVTKYCEIMSTTGVFSADKIAALQTSYAKLAKVASGEYISGYDEDIQALLEELAESLGGRRLAQLNAADLNNVLSIANNLDFIVTTLNEMEINGKREKVESAGNQAIAEADDKGTKKRIALLNTSFINKMKRSTFYGNLKPVMFFKDVVTGKIAELYDDIAKGEDTWGVRMLEAREFFTEKAKKYNFYDWADYSNKRHGKAKKTVNFTTAQGKKVELSTEEALSLYCTAKRNQGLQHILGGGFIPSEGNVRQIKEGKGKVSYEIIDKTPIVLNQDDLVKLASALTEEQKQFGDEMVKYLSTDVAKYGNDTSMKLFGYRKYLESYYFPISSSENYVYSRQTAVQDDTRLKHQSMTKATVPNANNPIVISPFIEVWGRHINDMASYSSFVVALENFNKVWNFRERNEDGTRGMSVKNAIENAYGNEATSYINQLMIDINGGVTMQNDTTASILMSKFKKGAVMASLSVSIQQPSAIARALALVDSRYFLKTTLKGRGEKTYDEMMKYAPVAIIKEMGFFDTGMGRRGADWVTAREYDKAVSKEVGLSLANAKQKGIAMFKDANFRDEVMGWLPGMMDKITWCHIWNAVKAETAAKTNLKGEELLKKAGERFTQVIHETQVYDSVFSRSENMRSKNPLTQMATAFMAEPTTALNMFIDSVVNAKNGQIKNASRTVAALVSSYALNAFLVSFIRAARDDEDKNFEEKYLVNFVSEFLQNLNPANQIPYLRDIINLAKGYDVERSDMSVVADLINLTGQVGKTITGTEEWTDENKKKLTDQIVTLFGVVSELSGVPVNNIIRDAKGLRNVLWRNTNDRLTWDSLWNSILKEYDKGLLAPFIKTKSNYDLYYDALIRGDGETAERIRGGLDESKINSRMLKLLKENEDIINAANSDTISAARTLADELVKKGFDEETVWKAIKGAIAKDETEKKETEKKETDSSDEIKALLKKDKRIEQAAQLRAEGNKSGWEKIRDELVNEGYDRNTVNSLIKDEVSNLSKQEETKEDTEETKSNSSEKSEYGAADINASLSNGRIADAQSYLDDFYEKNSKVYVNGTKSAKSTIKSNITSYFKPQYINGDRATRALIRSRLMALKVDGEPLYTEKNFNDWLK